jgi:putative endonuclease
MKQRLKSTLPGGQAPDRSHNNPQISVLGCQAMPSEKSRFGDFAERVARAHLEAKGYRVITTKFRVRQGEIDIVAQQDGIVALVEVKARRGAAMGSAIEGISPRKAQRLLAAGDEFAARHPELPADRRIDLIAIDLDATGRVVSLAHVESAVEDGYSLY